MKMNKNEIRISLAFLTHPPSPKKVLKKKNLIINNNMNQVDPIIINKKKIIIDGYATFIAMLELGFEDVEVIIKEK